MYDITQSAVLLEGEVSEQFNIGQGVAQGCSMSPILFSIFINQLLDEVEKAGIGITVKKDVKVGGLMFADDFVGLTTNAEDLQTLINIVQGFRNKWRLKSNIKKSAVMVFSKEVNTGACTWKWGDKDIPEVVSYCYLGIEFAKNGSWDSHVQKVINNGKKKLNQLHRFLSNRNISTVARRLLLVSILRPTLEYGSEVWACNKRQSNCACCCTTILVEKYPMIKSTLAPEFTLFCVSHQGTRGCLMLCSSFTHRPADL